MIIAIHTNLWPIAGAILNYWLVGIPFCNSSTAKSSSIQPKRSSKSDKWCAIGSKPFRARKATMSASLTPTQTLILWCLIGKGGGAWRSDVKPEPSASDRKALEKTRAITSEKRGRSLWLEVTETGWAWANDHLNAPLPSRTQSAGPILQSWLSYLHAFMRRRGIALAEIMAEVMRQTKPDDRPARNNALRNTGHTGLSRRDWRRLERTCATLSTENLLPRVPRQRLDVVLLKMQQASALVLFRLDNQREITEEDREAALFIAGEPRHVLRMGG